MPDFKQELSVFKIDSFILDLIIKSNSICYKFIFQNKKKQDLKILLNLQR